MLPILIFSPFFRNQRFIVHFYSMEETFVTETCLLYTSDAADE